MTKEQLKKLAEVAGKSVFQMMDYDGMKSWQPHEDVRQAFEVLNALRNYEINKCPIAAVVTVSVWNEKKGVTEIFESVGCSLPKTICEAALKAVN